MNAAPPILVNRPLLPIAERLLPYLQRIDTARYYTNFGQLHDELRTRLSNHLHIHESRLVLANSGTSALIALILATAGRAIPRKPLCICPAYTFVATAVAASACGYTPFLADISEQDWCLDPQQLLQLPQLGEASLGLAVAPYGQMPSLDTWSNFSRRTGLPVIVDAAACFNSIDVTALQGSGLSAAISLHATKSYSTVEGGLIICSDPATAERARRALNFGFCNNRESTGPSINGKISEYHAAVGLADLDGWSTKCAGFKAAATAYVHATAGYALQSRITADCHHANPYALFRAVNSMESARVMSALDSNRIGHRLWYGLGLHRQPEYRDSPAADLSVTDKLAPLVIGLPMASDMAANDVERVVATVAQALA